MRLRKVGDSVLTFAVIFVISLVLNYIWESMHEAFLYKVFKCEEDSYIMMILEAAVVDASIILGIYFGVAVLWRDVLWLWSMKGAQLLSAGIAGIIIAAAIEVGGVLVLKEWSYLPSMPTIFGIGLSPLIQLSVTGLLTFWLARRFLFQKCACEEKRA
jgi:hypothetical protein